MKSTLTYLAALAVVTTAAFGDGAALYQACVQCHGAQGEKVAPGGNSKVINTLSKDAIVAAVKGYQAGTYGGKTKALMAAPVKELDDAQIREIADYIGQ